ncbi:hypothetical protein AKJ47_01270 [candidate division MSBL1 archaeon SCGC-AAA261G05]|uniref:Uncharacterized protein n=2 Tax=candidate division MSBL1 TaxID=215777 RepID=A0A133VBZ0_9EURY|nr:hypothetical protein AKJ47_01270 [candidate division MSBL1 archaeon SCGC-AAA261G05]KXB04802.1 hypothetical protein AKJ48_01345 [candidate division MSBL1 archaeon SCGC-AAA261O19]
MFDEFRAYYDSLEYRFRVGEGELEDVIGKLRSYGFEVNLVEEDEISEYTVIIDKFKKHGDLLRNAVDVVELGDEKALVMKDKVAVEEALERGRKPDEEWLERL